MLRFGRTVRLLSPVQVAHRVRLRFRRALGRASGGVAAADRVPPLRPAIEPPLDLLRPCPRRVVRERAEEVAAGRFTFLSRALSLSLDPFPAPADESLLWAYHLEYMDYLLDLEMEGRRAPMTELVASRISARESVVHPYPDARRTASFVRMLHGARAGLREMLARGAFSWAGRVARNLEYDVGGNHLLENGLGLVLAGASFTGPRAAKWLAIGRRILLAGAREQVLPDGAHYELSPMYHARVLAVLTEGGLALEETGRPAPAEYWEAIARMVAFLGGVLLPDGRLPLLGDSAHDAFLEPDLLLQAVEERLPLRLGRARPGDRYFPDSGICVMADREFGHQLVLDAGPVCPDRLPAHGQADTFTFELLGEGRSLVADTGVFEYRAGEMRSFARSTRAHSTVTVDGADSSEVWSSFRVGRRARVREADWSVDRGFGTFRGAHDGYRHLGVTHRRLVSHLAPGLWLLLDSLRGSPGHLYESRIHLHPGVVIEQRDGGVAVHRGEVTLLVTPVGGAALTREDGWHCPAFGVRRRRQVLVLTAKGGTARMGFVLSIGREAPEVGIRDGIANVTFRGRRFARGLP